MIVPLYQFRCDKFAGSADNEPDDTIEIDWNTLIAMSDTSDGELKQEQEGVEGSVNDHEEEAAEGSVNDHGQEQEAAEGSVDDHGQEQEAAEGSVDDLGQEPGVPDQSDRDSEQDDEVATTSALTLGSADDWPKWFVDGIEHLKTISKAEPWFTLLVNFTKFERSLGFTSTVSK